jgi:hypothetical protein
MAKPSEIVEMVKRAQVEADSSWHLDRKVPIAMVVAILMQTGGMIWWGAKADARIETLERKAELAAPQDTRLTRVETKLEAVQDGISEIKSILRKEPTAPKVR